MAGPPDRYAIQRRIERIGDKGQARIERARAVVVGAGALGSTIGQQLVRAGVGTVLLVDDDVVELGNLHRQILYTEQDARTGRRKVDAAVERLRAANETVAIEGRATRFERINGRDLVAGAQVVLDATDNLETRYLINELCVAGSIPWVYGGVVATHGMAMPIVPGQSACLRCLFEQPGPEEVLPSTETYGVLGAAPAVIGALQVGAALRILVGGFEPPTSLSSIDVWTGQCDVIDVLRRPDCPTCGDAEAAAAGC